MARQRSSAPPFAGESTMVEEVLRAILPHLDRLGIPYLITGGIAATLHGRPRFTQDIDFVIAPTEE